MRVNIRSKYRKAYKVQTPFEKVTAGWDLESSNPEVKWYSDPSDPKRQMQVQYFIDKNTGDEKLQTVTYFKGGDLHREDGPADIYYYPNGNIETEEYYINNNLHREGGKPAVISYYPNGNLWRERYYKNNRLYRADGPSEIRYSENGNVEYSL